MKKRIIVFFALLILIGCIVYITNIYFQPSKKQKIDVQNNISSIDKDKKVDISKVSYSMLKISDKIPDWFYLAPKSDEYFYGAGEGRDPNEAKNSALNYIASEIQTTVSSEFSKTSAYSKSDSSTDFYEKTRKNINVNVSKISFSNIQIVKTVKVDNEIYILLRINKQELFRNLKNKFEMLDAKIDSEIKASQKYSLLDQKIIINKLIPKIADALNEATILSVLNPNFDIKPYVQKYNSYIEKKSEIYHKLTFKVLSNNFFAEKLIEVMNENNYKVGNSSNVKIRVIPNIRYSTPMDMSVARVTVTIQIIAKNKIFKSTSLEVKGISDTKSQAVVKAATQFKNQLEEKGINKLLGFE